MASVFKRKRKGCKPLFVAKVDLGERDAEGQIVWRMRSVPDKHQGSKGEALRWAIEHETEEQEKLKRGPVEEPGVEWTFAQLAEHWLDTHSRVALASHSDNVSRMKVLCAAFGTLRLSQLTADRIDEFKAARVGEVVDTSKTTTVDKQALKRRKERLAKNGNRMRSASTVNRYLALLRKVLNDGMKWRRKTGLRENAMDEVTLLPVPEQDFDYLPRDEAERFLDWTRDNAPDVFALYATAIYLGLRMGELYGLLWSDVDLERGQITVRRSYTTEHTKSKKIRRPKIGKQLAAILREWKLACPKKRTLDDGTVVDVPLAFPRPDGEMWSRERPPKGFEKHLRCASCHAITFHDLRHTAASLMVMAGTNLRAVQKILGHSTIAVTEKYAHLAPSFAIEQADLFTLDLSRGKVLPMPMPQQS